MLADKLRCTDWEATNEAMEEAVARESYLEWLRDREKCARGTRTLVIFSSEFFSIFKHTLYAPLVNHGYTVCVLSFSWTKLYFYEKSSSGLKRKIL